MERQGLDLIVTTSSDETHCFDGKTTLAEAEDGLRAAKALVAFLRGEHEEDQER